ncbi:MAG: hypothetical protein FJX35_16005 [Alphaproteobacteria bacterium]|nr:hypothetical protein [Alphaproteobacteria bacterium]
MAALAFAFVAIPAQAVGPEGAIPASGVIEFDILRNGSPFGAERIDFRRDGDRLIVDIKIDMEYRLLIPLFRYSHRSREVWKDGRLIQIDTTTDDDGEKFFVTGRATPRGFAVKSTSGEFTMPADVVPGSYWNEDMLSGRAILNTQAGKLVDSQVRKLPPEPVVARGQQVTGRVYDVTGDFNLRLWYGDRGDWVKLRFTTRGSEIEYVLRP